MKQHVSEILVSILIIGLFAVFMVSAETEESTMEAASVESVDETPEIVPLASIAPTITPLPNVYTVKSCTPTEVRAFYNSGSQNRVHVLCSENFSGIRFFAVKLSNNVAATTFTQLATEALTSGRYLRVGYHTQDLTGNEWGCLASNCREVEDVYISK